MAGRIRDEDIALVRERSPIDEVVGEYLQLRNAGGGSLKGLCPFHDEKTPSFNVTPARGLWYCFSCAEGGDVIKFVEKIDNLGFAEAVERLAARAGIELRYEQGGRVPGQEQSQRRRLLAAHSAAAEFFSERLRGPDAALAREFLSERGFETADAERFGVGYAPADWEALTRHLRGRGFTDSELLLGGLASQGRRGPVDRFRGRLMWPIRDVTGEVVGFGARRLAEEDTGPKYLNTPETPLFKKSSVLYAADLAKREIAQRRQAVIVEGYTDVMACHLAGVPTAVATCGTSFGDGHVKVLRRLLMDADQFRGEIIFTFDGDAAGQRAALRAFDLEERFVTQTFVAAARDGLDPCDLRRKQGDAAVRDLVAQRVPVYEFAIRSELAKHDLDTNEGRIAALDAAAAIIARIKDRGLRDRYAVSLDRWLGMLNEEFVLARVRERVAASGVERRGGPVGAGPGGRAGASGAGGQGRGFGAGPGGRAPGRQVDGPGPGAKAGGPGLDGAGPGRSGYGAGPGRGVQVQGGQGWSGQGPSGQGPSGQGPSGQGPSGQGSSGQGPRGLSGRGPSGQGPSGPGLGADGAGRGADGPGAEAGSGRMAWPERGMPGPGPGQRGGAELGRYEPDDPLIQVEREVLKLAVQRPALCGPAFDAIEVAAFTAPAHAVVRELIEACGGTAAAGGAREWVTRLRDAAADERVRGFVTQLAVEPLRAPRADGEPDARYAEAVLARVEELAVSRQVAVVKSRLQRLNPLDSQEYNRLFGDLIALEQRRKTLVEKAAGAL